MLYEVITRLGVNIDHVATLRQVRRAVYPSIVDAAALCEKAGAHGITVHLREDRRHIQDADVYALRKSLGIRITSYNVCYTKLLRYHLVYQVVHP